MGGLTRYLHLSGDPPDPFALTASNWRMVADKAHTLEMEEIRENYSVFVSALHVSHGPPGDRDHETHKLYLWPALNGRSK